MSSKHDPLCPTGVAGLDPILNGGLPRHRFYMVQGDPGVGKTTLALQFLLEGARKGEKGLYISLSETKDELLAVAASHNWNLAEIEILELSAVEEYLSAEAQNTLFHPSEVELMQTVKMVLDQVDRVKPDRIVIDSLSEFRLLSQDSLRYRRQMLSFKQFFSSRKSTVLLLDDRTTGDSDMLIQSIAHGVITLRKISSEFGSDRRQLNVLKLRGVRFEDGYHDYSILTGGIVVYPRLKMGRSSPPTFTPESLSCDIPEMDALLGGGIARGTSTLIIGPAGAGKSTLGAKYAAAAAGRGEKVAIFIFDENIHTYVQRAESLGMPLIEHLRSGIVTLKHVDAAEITPGEMAHHLCEQADKENVRVVIIDSLNGYLNAMPEERFLLLQLHELLAYLSQRGVASILIMAQHGMLGEMRAPADLTYLADTVLLLRFFEYGGQIRKAISVVKKRSGNHENAIREYMIRDSRLVVGPLLTDFQGILKGVPQFRGGPDRMLKTGEA